MTDIINRDYLLALIAEPGCRNLVAFHLAHLVTSVSLAAFATPFIICFHFVCTYFLVRLAPYLPGLLTQYALSDRFGVGWEDGGLSEQVITMSWSVPILVSSIIALVVLLIRIAKLMIVVKRAEFKRSLKPTKPRHPPAEWIQAEMYKLWILLTSALGCLDLHSDSRALVGPHGMDHSSLDYSRHGYNWVCEDMNPLSQSPVHVPEELLSCKEEEASPEDEASVSTASATDEAEASEMEAEATEAEARRAPEAVLQVYKGEMHLPLHRAVHEIRVNDSSLHANKMVLEGQTLHLAQFHFHSPAEHIVMRKNYGPVRMDAEIHFVFADHNNAPRAVVGFLLETIEKGHNAMLQDLLSSKRKSDVYQYEHGIIAAVANTTADPESLPFVAYDGSLTTPPCSGPIRWYLSHATMGPAQFDRLKILQENGHGGNWRAAHEMFCRKFEKVEVPCVSL